MGLMIAVLVGSVRSDRQGIKAASFVEWTLAPRGHDVTLVDPVALQLALLARMYKEYAKGEAPETLERLAALYRSADAFVVVSGEYNHSVPSALSNLLDDFLKEYLWRPSAIVCYSAGGFGGVRAAMPLRAILCELGMPSISSLFPIPKIQTALDSEGHAQDAALDRRFQRFASELEWYAEALRDRRLKDFRTDPQASQPQARLLAPPVSQSTLAGRFADLPPSHARSRQASSLMPECRLTSEYPGDGIRARGVTSRRETTNTRSLSSNVAKREDFEHSACVAPNRSRGKLLGIRKFP